MNTCQTKVWMHSSLVSQFWYPFVNFLHINVSVLYIYTMSNKSFCIGITVILYWNIWTMFTVVILQFNKLLQFSYNFTTRTSIIIFHVLSSCEFLLMFLFKFIRSSKGKTVGLEKTFQHYWRNWSSSTLPS